MPGEAEGDRVPGDGGEQVQDQEVDLVEDIGSYSFPFDGKSMKHISLLVVFLLLAFLGIDRPVTQAAWEWDMGAQAGYDSNVNRALDGEKSDTLLGAHLLLNREPSGDSRLDWALSTTAEGIAYTQLRDLSYASLTIAPSLVYSLHPNLRLILSPLGQAKGVQDSEQSALAFGGEVRLEERIGDLFYAGQYYRYKDSRANEEIYSFKENAAGLFLGMNWKVFFWEIGYEFSRGDSFLTVDEPTEDSSTNASGKGKRHRSYSSAFESEIIREKVDRHCLGLDVGIDWSRSLYSSISYTFTDLRGDRGEAISHSCFISGGYRF